MRELSALSRAAAISGLRGVFRTTGLGLLVAVPDDAIVALDGVWEFYVTVTAADYAAYTADYLTRFEAALAAFQNRRA